MSNIRPNAAPIRFKREDIESFDLGTIDGRAGAARVILNAGGHDEATDTELITHMIEAYAILDASGLMDADNGYRKLTNEEMECFQAGNYKAATSAPALIDYLTLLHPMFSSHFPTLGTDPGYRIIIGAWFFDPCIHGTERGALLIHEVLHGVLGHHSYTRLDPSLVNIAGDAIINQQIERSSGYDLPNNKDESKPMGVYPRTIKPPSYPNGMPENLSFIKYYYGALEMQEQNKNESMSSSLNGNGSSSSNHGKSSADGNGSSTGTTDGGESTNGGESSDKQSGTGNASSNDGGSPDAVMDNGDGTSTDIHISGNGMCREVSAKEEGELDNQGVEKAGELQKAMARAAAKVKAMAELEKDSSKFRGTSGTDFNQFILDALNPPKLNWQVLLGGILSRTFNSIISGHEDFSYKHPNRRIRPNGFIMPGSVAYSPKGIIGCDTSGSMDHDDYMNAISEVDGLCRKRQVNDLTFLTVDTSITSIQTVTDPKKLRLGSGGGTVMKVFYDYLSSLRNTGDYPDFSVLMTDGFIDWDDCMNAMDKRMRNIILVTNAGGFNTGKMYDKMYRNLRVLPIFNEDDM